MVLKSSFILFCIFSFGGISCIAQHSKEQTMFQTSQPWCPTLDNRGDVAIIYGINGNPTDKTRAVPFTQRVHSWRDRGYTTHFMTGIAWGEYQDYFTGKWDGVPHMDEGQVRQEGDTIWHGHQVPYIVPTENYLTYIKEAHIKKVIDAGIDAIYMEEPEFWARGGYSEAFKREWKKYYGFDWQPQHESPNNTYLSNKLKYQLYYHALKEVFTYAKEYGRSKGMNVRCYVPTHSLLNYSQWMIVSPEASLASLDCVDGYIAQVWTGTSREPNFYNGIQKERVFETAFVEYGSMESMTAPTGRKMTFLTDPIEDQPRDWSDYKKNYEATFTAQLLYPRIANYEIMPWPERIYEGWYRASANSDERIRIPRHYSTQMQIMINALNHMPVSDNQVSGNKGIGALMSNSLMFQRFPKHAGYSDPYLSNFLGQVLPFLKRGVPVSTVHIENVEYPETWKGLKILLMSYSNMKPMSPDAHKIISQWVYQGGTLVYSGRDNDPFQSVQEWWNTGNQSYQNPSAHLFEMMGMAAFPQTGEYKYGKGTVFILRNDPKEYVLSAGSDEELVKTVSTLYQKKTKESLYFKNSFVLERGMYKIIAVLDESVTNEPYIAKGKYIDLFDPQLPVLETKEVSPGTQALLIDIDQVDKKKKSQVLASSCRIYDEKSTAHTYSFTGKAPVNTSGMIRILLPARPKSCTVTNNDGRLQSTTEWKWDASSKTCLLSCENHPDGIAVSIEW